MDETLMVGSYTIPFLLTLILAVVYSFFTAKQGDPPVEISTLTDKTKNAIALGAGVLLGIAALILKWDAGGFQLTASNIILYALNGFIQGAAAVGLWKSFTTQAGK